jgi:hypothetical protein
MKNARRADHERKCALWLAVAIMAAIILAVWLWG